MFASESTKPITLANGQVVKIRKLSQLEWVKTQRMMRDAKAPDLEVAARDAREDAVDRYVLETGVVELKSDAPVTWDQLADLDADVAIELGKRIIAYTRPGMFGELAQEYEKNGSSGSTPTSTETPEPQASGN